jgi:hypothetical protein
MVVSLVLHQRLLLRPPLFGLAAQFKINESVHARVALVKINVCQPGRGKTTHFRHGLRRTGDSRAKAILGSIQLLLNTG